jgi:hypothetical protein
MQKKMTILAAAAVLIALVWMAPQIAEAGRLVLAKAELTTACPNCQVPDIGGNYSVLGDGLGAYENGDGVKAQIISHNTIYNLDTLNTLVNGHVVAGVTRTVKMHFYSPVENQFPGHVLPPCWGGNYDQEQAVNWIILSDNSQTLTGMQVGQQVQGRARADFNVRNGSCEGQIFRYYLQWHNVCITRTSATTWDATTDLCGRERNYGTATLSGQGGRRKETVDYGDWRLPFKMTITLQ